VQASDGTHTAIRDVTVTVTNVNEPPQFPGSSTARSVDENTAAGQNVGGPVAIEIPGVDMTTMRHMPWTLDLGEYFTDPDGDSLSYDTSGQASDDVVRIELDGDVMSITPVGGAVTIEVVADQTLPPMDKQAPVQSVSPAEDVPDSQGFAPLSVALEEGGSLAIWLILLLTLVALLTAGYGVRMYVMHRL